VLLVLFFVSSIKRDLFAIHCCLILNNYKLKHRSVRVNAGADVGFSWEGVHHQEIVVFCRKQLFVIPKAGRGGRGGREGEINLSSHGFIVYILFNWPTTASLKSLELNPCD